MSRLPVFALSMSLCYETEVWMRDLVAAKLDVLSSEKIQFAAGRLLSALCDADALIGSDFKVLDG